MKCSVSVREAAKVFGKDPAWVRKGLVDGTLPIGTAIKMSNRYNYYISPKLLEEYTGYRKENNNGQTDV